MDARPIDANALLAVPNVNWVYQYDETGEYIKYKAVPVEAIEKAPTLDLAPKWISVKDRLPEDCEDVLVLVGGNVDVGYHSQAGYWECYSYRNNNVTHWMPLLEPPKESKK